jgi:hypothetical protein
VVVVVKVLVVAAAVERVLLKVFMLMLRLVLIM